MNYVLLLELVRKEIKIRYKNSYLGYFWSLANPALMAIIFYYVFKLITRVQIENYALILVSGLFLWHWISNSITASLGVFIGNAGLIKKTSFDKKLLVLAMVISEGFNFILSVPVIFVLMFWFDISISYLFFLFPLFVIVTALFLFSISLIAATINVYFRDMERIVALLLMISFYFTPILYTVDMIPDEYRYLVYFNPFYYAVTVWKSILFSESISSFLWAGYLIIIVILSFIAFWVFCAKSDRFAEVV